MYVVDVAIEELDVAFVASDVFHRLGIAFVDVDGDGFDMLFDVTSGGGVEGDEVEGRYFIVALVAGNEHPFECAATADA